MGRSSVVIPAEAGIQNFEGPLDSRFHGNDDPSNFDVFNKILLQNIRLIYFTTPWVRKSLSSAVFKPSTPPSTSSVCCPRAGESVRMLAGVFDK